MLRSILPSVSVLFHEVSDSGWFSSVLDAIGRLYAFAPGESVEDLYRKKQPSRGSCHITFDDGHTSFYNNAFPVLKDRNIPSTVFFSPRVIREETAFWFQKQVALCQLIGKKAILEKIAHAIGQPVSNLENYGVSALLKAMPVDHIAAILTDMSVGLKPLFEARQNMNVAECEDVLKSGLVNFGAHTLDHPILANETEDRVEYELERSKLELEDMFAIEIRHLAYPNGKQNFDFGLREMTIARKLGFCLAYSTDSGFLTKGNSYAVPRVSISDLENPYRVLAKLCLAETWDHLRGAKQEKQRIALRNEYGPLVISSDLT